MQFVQKTKRQEVVKNGEKKAHTFLYILQLTMSQFAMKNSPQQNWHLRLLAEHTIGHGVIGFL